MFTVFSPALAQTFILPLIELYRFHLARQMVFPCSCEDHMDVWVLRVVMMHRIPVQVLVLHLFQVAHHLTGPLPPVLYRLVIGGGGGAWWVKDPTPRVGAY